MRGFRRKKIPDKSLYPINSAVMFAPLPHTWSKPSASDMFWTEICPNLSSARIGSLSATTSLGCPCLWLWSTTLPSNHRSALIIIPPPLWSYQSLLGPQSGLSFKLKLSIDLAFLIILLASSLPFNSSWSSRNVVFIGKTGTSAGGSWDANSFTFLGPLGSMITSPGVLAVSLPDFCFCGIPWAFYATYDVWLLDLSTLLFRYLPSARIFLSFIPAAAI